MPENCRKQDTSMFAKQLGLHFLSIRKWGYSGVFHRKYEREMRGVNAEIFHRIQMQFSQHFS